eukprot:scaffold13.g227.t1
MQTTESTRCKLERAPQLYVYSGPQAGLADDRRRSSDESSCSTLTEESGLSYAGSSPLSPQLFDRSASAPAAVALRLASMGLDEASCLQQAPSLDSQSLGWGGRPLTQQTQSAPRFRRDECGLAFVGRSPAPGLGPRAGGARGAAGPRPQQQPHGAAQGPQQHGGACPGRPARSPAGEARVKHQGYRRLWQQVTQVSRGGRLGEPQSGGHFPDMTVEDLLEARGGRRPSGRGRRGDRSRPPAHARGVGGVDGCARGARGVVVRRLPPEASAVRAISQGLYFLDSGALAALLKELNKSGHSRRAAEVFDWLRGLPDAHDLYPLCNTMTYTTMISQCGSAQQLRRALELVAEMRGRGVQCNVHTYSALMNMLAEGCTPNLVTYNTLIDVYGKTGAWEDAVRVLDALEQQGIDPEIRTYNTVIIACNMSGQATEALRIYERMLASGAQPTATTYTALISAYGKNGQLDRALQIFQDMVRRGCERNVITYSSLISACEKAGRWELALELFREMHTEGCRPNVVTYNSLIAACAQGAQWQRAQEMFEQMQAKGCRPDSVTFGGLIAAYDRAGLWRQALRAFEQMKGHNCRPDSVVYNTVVGALWKTGLVWAQAKATQIFHTACRQGHFRLTVHTLDSSASPFLGHRPGGGTSPAGSPLPAPDSPTGGAGAGGERDIFSLHSLASTGTPEQLSPAPSLAAGTPPVGGCPSPQGSLGDGGATAAAAALVAAAAAAASPTAGSPAGGAGATTLIEFGMHAFTVGSAVLSLLRWVAELRERLPREPTRELRQRVCLVLNKGKPGRDQAYPAIHAALAAMLAAWAAPMALLDAPQGCRVEGRAGEVAAWLRTPPAEAALAAFGGRGGLAESPRAMTRDAFFSEDVRIEARCAQAFCAVRRFEDGYFVAGSALPPSYLAARAEWFTTAATFAGACGFKDEVVHDAQLLLDRTVAAGGEAALALPPAALVVACVLTTAAQAGEPAEALPADARLEAATGLAAATVAEATAAVAAFLRADTSAISALRVAKLYLERLGADFGSEEGLSAAAGPATMRLLAKAACDPGLHDCRPSLLAAAVLRAGRRAAGITPFWPETLATLTSLTDGEGTELAAASAVAARLLA